MHLQESQVRALFALSALKAKVDGKPMPYKLIISALDQGSIVKFADAMTEAHKAFDRAGQGMAEAIANATFKPGSMAGLFLQPYAEEQPSSGTRRLNSGQGEFSHESGL